MFRRSNSCRVRFYQAVPCLCQRSAWQHTRRSWLSLNCLDTLPKSQLQSSWALGNQWQSISRCSKMLLLGMRALLLQASEEGAPVASDAFQLWNIKLIKRFDVRWLTWTNFDVRSEAVLADLQRRLGPVKTVPRRAASLMVPVLLCSILHCFAQRVNFEAVV